MSKPRSARQGARDDLARRPPQREPRERILVVCEGKVTEPTYLRSFAHDARNPLVQVEIDPKHGVPLTVVKRAIARRDEAAARAKSERDENLAFDKAWAVVNVYRLTESIRKLLA